MNFSGTVEQQLREFERPVSPAEKAERAESLGVSNRITDRAGLMRGAVGQAFAEGMRTGIANSNSTRGAGSIKAIGEGSISNSDGTDTVGVFVPGTKDVGLSVNAVEHFLPEQINLDASGEADQGQLNRIKQHVAEKAKDVLDHEHIHESIEGVAEANNEVGLISSFLGEELYTALHEWAASMGTTEDHDAYDAERSRAESFIAQIGMSQPEAYGYLTGRTPSGGTTKGSHMTIVMAAFMSNYPLKQEMVEMS